MPAPARLLRGRGVAQILAALLLQAALAATPELVAFAEREWRADPALRAEDAYKWLFQACRGGEHAAPSPEAARAWLEREWGSLDRAAPDEPLVAPLRPDGALVRLNLRPYRDRGGRPALLLESFLRSATAFSGDDRLLRESWSALGERLRGGPIGGIDLEGWRRLDAELARAGYPAAHHSAAYEAMRRPAYRVLTGDEAGVLAKSLASAR